MTPKPVAKYWPAGGKLLARITLGGELIAIFKKPPTDEQGHAMAKSLVPAELPEAKKSYCDPYADGFNTCLQLWKESLQ
jgi:hypothetical protein